MSLLLLLRPLLTVDVTVTATPGTLNLRGGTHTLSSGGSVAGTAGILNLSGGTHTISGEIVFLYRALMGAGL